MYFPLKMVIFHCFVSLPEGIPTVVSVVGLVCNKLVAFHVLFLMASHVRSGLKLVSFLGFLGG